MDIENLKGAGAMSDADSHLIRKTLFELFPRRPEDLVVVGSGCNQSLLASRIWTGARLVFRKGHNGADLALLDVLKNENVAQRFDRLVLASGDGIFTGIVRRLANEGMSIHQVGVTDHVSRALSEAADESVRIISPSWIYPHASRTIELTQAA
ncbi:NYN domain-containing protein [Bifidobacterium stellenboschense]|uniref:NYN domain-containing protein n=1 Tax=Bifidobacterium stellenboschense TaxID=762211 RepID=UPI00138E4AE3|nr:NYN domain-containing protein [Bifidobacterium stellenboschense]